MRDEISVLRDIVSSKCIAGDCEYSWVVYVNIPESFTEEFNVNGILECVNRVCGKRAEHINVHVSIY